MPAAYEAIKMAMRKAHPKWSDKKLKSAAAATYISRSKDRHKAAKALQHG